MKEFIKKNWIFIIIAFLVIIKCILTINLPINVRDHVGADEYLMLSQAESLIKGEWLGPYTYLTIVKGIGFPFFLMLAFKLGISYLSLYSLFYVGACLISLIPLRKMISNKIILLLIFSGLLFCPASFDNNVQLVYRNMLIIPQSILLIASLMMMYYEINTSSKKLLFWSLMFSFDWIFLCHTREDSIWSIPVVIVTLFILFINLLILHKKENKKIFLNIFIILIPLIMLFVSNNLVSYVNYKKYGIYTTNQLNKTNYAKAVNLLMKIKPDKTIDHVIITRDALQKAYDVSPTFSKLKNTIENDYDSKVSLVMAEEDNGEVNEDLITWELLGAANINGYYENANKAEKFWGQVYQELNEAINSGKLQTRKILPSRSLIPYPNKKDSLSTFIKSIIELFDYGVKYKYSYIELYKTNYDEDLIRRYETITGAYAIREDKYTININGYVFNKNNNEELKAYLVDSNDKIINELSFKDSFDIYDYYLKFDNKKYTGAKKARISQSIDMNHDIPDKIHFIVKNKSNKIVFLYNLNDKTVDYFDDSYISIVDSNNSGIMISSDKMVGRANRYVRIGNKIKNIYSYIGVPMLIIGLIYYIILTIRLVLYFKYKSSTVLEKWLFLSLTLGSTTILLAGLGYVNAFMVKVIGYLSSANGLLNLFIFASNALMINDLLIILRKNIKNEKNA